MDPNKDDREVCGTCGNNHYSFEESEFCCSSEASEYYGCSTGYVDHCEEWCRK